MASQYLPEKIRQKIYGGLNYWTRLYYLVLVVDHQQACVTVILYITLSNISNWKYIYGRVLRRIKRSRRIYQSTCDITLLLRIQVYHVTDIRKKRCFSKL